MKKDYYVFKKSSSKIFDMLRTKKLPNKVLEKIKSSPTSKINLNYNVNKLANSLHPRYQKLYVAKIIDENSTTKSFILKSKDNKLAYFKAGQYLSFSFKDESGYYISRPYSISSSPQDALNGFYRITIKIKDDGYFSKLAHNKLKVNDVIYCSDPSGDFFYNKIRDPKHIVAIAAGSGITPFLSLAKSINEKTDDFKLTILYSVKTFDDILFKNELDDIVKKANNQVQVFYYITNEEIKSNDKNIINKRIDVDEILKYHKKNDGLWLCCPKKMNNFYVQEFLNLGSKKKDIRWEHHNEFITPKNFDDYKPISKKQKFKIILNQFDKKYEIEASADEPIIVSIQRAKININNRCLSGACSYCQFKLLKGNVFLPKEKDHRRESDKQNNIYYSCVTYPLSDLEITIS